MGLFDRSKPPRPPTQDDWLRIGRLEAEVESLALKWESYRDEIKRLVNRLEKRDQRAAEREARMADETPVEPVEPEPEIDEITARVLARRNRNGIQRDIIRSG